MFNHLWTDMCTDIGTSADTSTRHRKFVKLGHGDTTNGYMYTQKGDI